jgi:transcriptional regulator with GAF, ATPase, and Fis domain
MYRDPATKYQLLLRLNNSVINQYTPEGLFQSLATEMSRIFHYDRFSINIYDEKTQQLSYFGAPDGVQPSEIGKRVRPIEKGSIAQLVITSKKPVFIYDLAQNMHLETAQWLIEAGLRCVMAYPMIIRDRILGSIHFSFKNTPPHVHELRKFLDDLSVQVAIAVANMISYNIVRDRSENLERMQEYLMDHREESYRYREEEFYYVSEPMIALMKEARLSAATDASILITGETGTGKGHIARYIHQMSTRKDQLFVSVNCPALAPSLIESELFGHVKGAYTGAHSARTGRFEMAHKGTIFLDEIGELPLYIQAKLLQILQERTFEAVGDSTPRTADFRMIAATNQNLELKVKDKTFRSDLYYRLNTIHFPVPPLRERIEDLPLLLNCFMRRFTAKMGRPEIHFSVSAMDALCRYTWPGNVRELENIVERLMILRAGETVTEADIARFLNPAEDQKVDNLMTRSEMEKRHIEEALTRCHGVVAGEHGAARLLGMRRSTLQYRMKKLRINPSHVVPKNRE